MEFKNILTESVSWNYFNKFNSIIEKYMPISGEGETIASQIVTAVNKLIYKWYNDGDVFDNTSSKGLQGWANDLSCYANWLYRRLRSVRPILDRVYECDESKYSELLKDLADLTLKEEFLNQFADRQKIGSIYDDVDGPFYFNTDDDYDEGDDYDYDDYYDECLEPESNKEDKIDKALNEELGINVLNENLGDGWDIDFDEYPEVDEILDNLYNFVYEMKNCIRGSYTNVTSYPELAEYIRYNLVQSLEQMADCVDHMSEENSESDDTLDENLDTELTSDTKFKDAYKAIAPDDYQLDNIDPNKTIKEIWEEMQAGGDIYKIASVDGKGFDSTIREQLFIFISQVYNIDYDVVYKQWLAND